MMAAGTLLGAVMLVRSSARAVELGGRSRVPPAQRLASASFYIDHVLPRAAAHLTAVRSGVGILGEDDALLG